jgi:hypothetical protein
MDIKYCLACGHSFQPRPQAPRQCYCRKHECQRERRRRWQSAKLQSDSDYRDNQARAQQAWCNRNPDYWREYRAQHKRYQERNRELQRKRNAKRKANRIAKMDASNEQLNLSSGIYLMSRIAEQKIAKMDVWTVEITLLSREYDAATLIAKR